MHDLIIVGGGPAGISAGIYAARKKLNTLIITKEWGGQSVVSPDIQNWVGTISISGGELAKRLKEHLDSYSEESVKKTEGRCVVNMEKSETGFAINDDKNEKYEAKAVLIASGARRRKLDVPGAEQFDQKGLTYCATCDGPLFAGADVVVIGGGNAGFETASQLLEYTKSVTLLDIEDEFRADPSTVEKVLKNSKMKAVKNAKTTKIAGEKFVNAVEYVDENTGETKRVPATGVFVEIGIVPNTSFAEKIVPLDKSKRIEVDGKTQRTKILGIWGAGDCTNELYHQNNIAAGDAIKAVEDIFNYLKR